LCTLRRGDHCVIAINFVRGAHPLLDYAISCLGSIEICYLYHHFIIVDDVSCIDEQGVPRTSQGTPARLFECGNTLPEAYEEIWSYTKGHWLQRLAQWPFVFLYFLVFYKAKFLTHPIADYGDTPHIYRVLAKQSPEERERAIQEALRVEQKPKRYNVFTNNCEHICNHIRKGEHKSIMVSFVMCVAFRTFLSLLGLAALRFHQDALKIAGMIFGHLCPNQYSWELVAYHTFTSVPVALQAMISYVLLMHSAYKQHAQDLIDRHEFYHLLSKELGRVIVVGGLTIVAISLSPSVVSSFCMQFVVCAFAYFASDVVYNCMVHAVMRLVLLPTYGSVWVLGQDSRPKSP